MADVSYIQVPYNDGFRAGMKAIRGTRWRPETREWEYPVERGSEVKALFSSVFPHIERVEMIAPGVVETVLKSETGFSKVYPETRGVRLADHTDMFESRHWGNWYDKLHSWFRQDRSKSTRMRLSWVVARNAAKALGGAPRQYVAAAMRAVAVLAKAKMDNTDCKTILDAALVAFQNAK